MTRQSLLFCGAIGMFGGWAMLARAGDEPEARGAYVVFMLLVGVALAASASMLAKFQARAGYPVPLAFGRPVRTAQLVGVPVLYLALACAATYALPAAVLRAAFGAPFPLLSVAVLLAAAMAVLIACNWSTRNKTVRLLATIASLAAVGPALRWLDSWNAPAGGTFPPPLSADLVKLDMADYALIAIAVAAAYVATVRGVDRQRHGGGESRAERPSATARAGAAPKAIVEHVRDAVLALVRLPCPTSSPLAAELWIEVKARGLPVVTIGILFALGTPVVIALVNLTGARGALPLLVFGLMLPFFAGISASFWNRESSLRAPMSGFEAVRPMTTARLAAIQIAVAAASILLAYTLLGASVWWSLPLLSGVIDFAPWQRALADALAAWPTVHLLSAAVVALCAFVTVVALLATIRAYSVRYGLRIWWGALAAVLYTIAVAFAIALEWLSADVVGVHLWVVAAAIVLVTAYVIVRALAGGVLLPLQGVAVTLGWAAFAAVLWYVARESGFFLAARPPALEAFLLALAVLPLTAAVLAAWSLASIRHA